MHTDGHNLIFTNLVNFNMVYGHRHDAATLSSFAAIADTVEHRIIDGSGGCGILYLKK